MEKGKKGEIVVMIARHNIMQNIKLKGIEGFVWNMNKIAQSLIFFRFNLNIFNLIKKL